MLVTAYAVVPPPVFCVCRIGCGNAEMTTAGAVRTVTVASGVAERYPLNAVSVYVVVVPGVTVTEPKAGCAPIPLSMITDVAPPVVHESVDDCPGRIVGGTAPKESTRGVSTGVEPASTHTDVSVADPVGVTL